MYGGAPATRQGTPPPATRVTPRRPQSPLPLTKPKSLEAGMAEHQVRGEAKTVKVPLTPSAVPRDERKTDTERMPAPADDDARDSLFAGLGESSDKAEPKKEDTTILRQAERMEELGFHNQVVKTAVAGEGDSGTKKATASEETKAEAVPAAATAPAAPVFRIPGQPAGVTIPAATPVKRPASNAGEATVSVAPPVNRTQTQELDDILSRIDKVLAENPVMATTTLGSASGEATVGPKPTPPRPEDNRVDSGKPPSEPPAGQQKLF